MASVLTATRQGAMVCIVAAASHEMVSGRRRNRCRNEYCNFIIGPKVHLFRCVTILHYLVIYSFKFYQIIV